MGRVSDLNERRLIAFVRSGEWEIDAAGRIWRVMLRTGNRYDGGFRVVTCKRRRVEKATPQGYLQVRAMVAGKRLHCGAHRLVWQHFRGDIPPGDEINHRNGLKDDNRPDNLLCGSAGENMEHAHAGGLRDQHGEKNPAVKLTDNQVAQIRLAYSQGGHTMAALAARFSVAVQTISRIVRGQRRCRQGGPVLGSDQRHDACEHDSATGRFVGKKRAGRVLDGRTWDELPPGGAPCA